MKQLVVSKRTWSVRVRRSEEDFPDFGFDSPTRVNRCARPWGTAFQSIYRLSFPLSLHWLTDFLSAYVFSALRDCRAPAFESLASGLH